MSAQWCQWFVFPYVKSDSTLVVRIEDDIPMTANKCTSMSSCGLPARQLRASCKDATVDDWRNGDKGRETG